MKQPLNWENASENDDFIDFYNPNKGAKPGAYAQIYPRHPEGLVPQRKDDQYEGIQ